MGLDASVRCRCRECSADIPAEFRGRIEVDSEDYLQLVGGTIDAAVRERWEAWLADGCAHPDGCYARERIGNWAAVNGFRETLKRVDASAFSTLQGQLPDVNGGLCDAGAAARMLVELDVFLHRGECVLETVLVVDETGAEVAVAAPDSAYVFAKSDGIEQGLDAAGFYLRTASATVLRSVRFEQIVISVPATVRRAVAFRDHDGIDAVLGLAVLGTPIAGVVDARYRPMYPSRFRIERRAVTADYRELVAALRTVCTASVETGNPIRWH